MRWTDALLQRGQQTCTVTTQPRTPWCTGGEGVAPLIYAIRGTAPLWAGIPNALLDHPQGFPSFILFPFSSIRCFFLFYQNRFLFFEQSEVPMSSTRRSGISRPFLGFELSENEVDFCAARLWLSGRASYPKFEIIRWHSVWCCATSVL
jgi:hypothetical protein